MRAARQFVLAQQASGNLARVTRVRVRLYGSLAATGRGHGSHRALMLGFEARRPRLPISTACGGFVATADEAGWPVLAERETRLPLPFASARTLLALCERHGLAISGVMLRNEREWRPEADVRAGLLAIWEAMQQSVRRGCQRDGKLPGLHVDRRAAKLHRQLVDQPAASRDPPAAMDWVNLYALAVNEENAMGGRVVTAPTNGAAGIIPAVLHYYARFCDGDEDGVVRFLLTARRRRDTGVDGLLEIYKKRLQMEFGDRFLRKSRRLMNAGSPLFEFLFCAGNPAGTGLACSIAGHILDHM